jgi:hypothetical protein
MTMVYFDGVYWGTVDYTPSQISKEFRGYRTLKIKVLAGDGPRFAVNLTRKKNRTKENQ